VLVDIEELSYKDAAKHLGVPVGTVMSRLHRGRRALADAVRPAPSESERLAA
jgi:RNA polymerase sigma-70 factor, ECF subfamily